MRTVLLAIFLIFGLAWVACSRPQQSEPPIGVTPLGELAQDDPPYRPDAGGDPEEQEDSGGGDAGDAGDDLSYDERFSDDAGDGDEESEDDDSEGDDSGDE